MFTLAALKPFPHGIVVDGLSGDATFAMQRNFGWFGIPWQTTSLDVGDLIVTRESATQDVTENKKVSCAYQLSAVRGVTDAVGLRFGLVSASDVARQPLGAFSGACFHTNLMRSIELSNEVTGAVNEDITGRQPLTATDLLMAPVPAACQHAAGTLNGGRLPGIPAGEGSMSLAWIDGSRPVDDLLSTGDLTGDGTEDAAAVLSCNAGGVAWPEIVAFYAHGPQLLGALSLDDVNLPGHDAGENAFVNTLRYNSGSIAATWSTEQSGDAAATPTLDYSADLRWNGHKIIATHVNALTEIEPARRFIAAIRQGQVGAAAALAAGGVAADAKRAATAHPLAFAADFRCYGLIDLGIPAAAQPLVDAGAATEVRGADRLCLLPTGPGAQYVALGMKKIGFGSWQVAWIRVV